MPVERIVQLHCFSSGSLSPLKMSTLKALNPQP